MFKNTETPEKILEQVNIYLSDRNVPDYVAEQALKKGIKSNPQNNELKAKLKIIQESKKQNISQYSPKTLYGILVVLIGLLGFILLFSWTINKTNTYGLFIGISFLAISAVIYRQYKKEK